MRRQMNAVTRSIREIRKSTSDVDDDAVRNELPTLPEIIVEVNRTIVAEAEKAATRHSDAKKLRRYNWWEKTIESGVAETVKRVVGLLLIGVVGWMAHELLGTTSHERRVEPLTHERQ